MSNWFRWLIAIISFALVQSAASAVDINAFWAGKAHFEQVGSFNWTAALAGSPQEGDGWFAVHDGHWYVFNRAPALTANSACPQDHTRVVIRESNDRGRSWSAPTTAVAPGASPVGDLCAVLDGSSFYDRDTNTWHMLAQCLDRPGFGGWDLCHYTLKGSSPLGLFTADPRNPVVRGGALWSQICSGTGKSCPPGTIDEGTPDIVAKRDGRFLVTFHGYDPRTKDGFRGVTTTRDFESWQVSGDTLPNDATLGPADCRAWLADCSGVGEGDALITPGHIYMIVERMNKGLLCTTNQDWKFELVRTSGEEWPRSGGGAWQKLPGAALLGPARPNAATVCPVSYARWLVDGASLYLVYEDADPGRTFVHRRLMKLVAGSGPTVKSQ